MDILCYGYLKRIGFMNEKVLNELKKLSQDIYTEGYICGIRAGEEEKWFSAYAKAMFNIAHGIDIYILKI